MANIKDYTGLIAGYPFGKPKFEAMVGAVAGAFVDQINLLGQLPDKFDLDSAVGVQLDVDGEWVGISRRVKAPIVGVYFSFDTAGLGFDQGAWKGPYDPDSGIVVLDDETYRLLIRAKIAANQWNGTMETLPLILRLVFGDQYSVYIEDNQDMSMTIGIAGNQPPALLVSLLVGGYIPLKPVGVRVNYVVATNPTPIFGFDVDNQYISGFDSGAWGKSL